MTLESFVRIVWTVFEKFEIFMGRTGEKKNKKKRYECISSRKLFPTPKKCESVCPKRGELGRGRFQASITYPPGARPFAGHCEQPATWEPSQLLGNRRDHTL